MYAEETHAYDLMNREIRYVDGEGGMTTRSYDQNGRLKTVVMANENAKVAENALYRAHGYTYHYDQQDRLLSVMGPDRQQGNLCLQYVRQSDRAHCAGSME